MATPLNGSILKGFKILSLFTDQRRQVSTTEVCNSLGMNTATAHRLLMTLEQAGALQSARRGLFSLGPEIERLGWLAEDSNSMATIITPKLEALSGQLNESVMACRLARHGPTCIAVANSRRAISVNIKVGTLLPLHRSAQGRLWLAQMSEEECDKRLTAQSISSAEHVDRSELDVQLHSIRHNGYALNLGDNEPDIAALSMPVHDQQGRMLLSISIFGMLSRFDEPFILRARENLAAAISELEGLLD